MSYLRNKYRALLGALNQEDSEIWNGYIAENYLKVYTGKYINNKGGFGTQANYDIWIIKIPKGATSVSLKLNSPYSYLQFGGGNQIIQCWQKEEGGNKIKISGCQFNSKTVELPIGYSILAITKRNDQKDKATFEFSKNSGGTKLLTQ